MFTAKVNIHLFAYAVKLKVELIVLNQLLALIKHDVAPRSCPAPDEEILDASGPACPRKGKHVSFPSSEKTATATEDKTMPESTENGQVIARDMEYESRDAPHLHHTDPDIIYRATLPLQICLVPKTLRLHRLHDEALNRICHRERCRIRRL